MRKVIAAFLVVGLPVQTLAWSRPGHMVTAAIAYDELRSIDPTRLAELAELLDHHPDRGAFEVAIDRAKGDERSRRLFYECARWPDDARLTVHDHPTWHYSALPVLKGQSQEVPSEGADVTGAAVEAFTLNLRVLNDASASKPERAIALCWLMHIVGDIHQPLHTAQMVSDAFPTGDALGSRQFVRESDAEKAVTLHWLWDDSVHRSGTIESVKMRAQELTQRTTLSGVDRSRRVDSAAFVRWAQLESYPLAVRAAYAADLYADTDIASAPVIPKSYQARMIEIAERQVHLAGVRIADTLRSPGDSKVVAK